MIRPIIKTNSSCSHLHQCQALEQVLQTTLTFNRWVMSRGASRDLL